MNGRKCLQIVYLIMDLYLKYIKNTCMLSCFSLVQLFVNPMECRLPGSSVHDSPGKNTGVGCHALFQGIFPNQGSNLCLLCLLHWQAGSLPLAPPKTLRTRISCEAQKTHLSVDCSSSLCQTSFGSLNGCPNLKTTLSVDMPSSSAVCSTLGSMNLSRGISPSTKKNLGTGNSRPPSTTGPW